jgi:hypothetical protein
MSDSNKVSFRLSPALQTALATHVRQHGGRVSDILREALEAYLGLRPTARPTDQVSVSDKVSDSAHLSDSVSDLSASIQTLVSDITTLQDRLERLEASMQPRPFRVRQRPTARPTLRPSSLPPPRTYDPEMALTRMQELKAQGLSLAQIALTLNQEGIPTRHGRPWHKGTVAYLRRCIGSKSRLACQRRVP